MRKKLFLFFILFLVIFSLNAEQISDYHLMKVKDGFCILKVFDNSILIKKNNNNFIKTKISENLNDFFMLRFLNNDNQFSLFAFKTNMVKIFELENIYWKKTNEISYEELNKSKIKERIYKENNKKNIITNKNIKAKKENNLIYSGNRTYILPEDFDYFRIDNSFIYTLKIGTANYIIKEYRIKKDGIPYPPLNVVKKWEHNYSIYLEEYIYEVEWARNPLNSGRLHYNIYKKMSSKPDSAYERVEEEISTVVFFYWDRGLEKEDENKYEYGVSVVDVTLMESSIATTDGRFVQSVSGPLNSYIFINNE